MYFLLWMQFKPSFFPMFGIKQWEIKKTKILSKCRLGHRANKITSTQTAIHSCDGHITFVNCWLSQVFHEVPLLCMSPSGWKSLYGIWKRITIVRILKQSFVSCPTFIVQQINTWIERKEKKKRNRQVKSARTLLK